MGQETRPVQSDLDLKRDERRQVKGPVALPDRAAITNGTKQDQTPDRGAKPEEPGKEPGFADIAEEVEKRMTGIGLCVAEVGNPEDLEPPCHSEVPDHHEP